MVLDLARGPICGGDEEEAHPSDECPDYSARLCPCTHITPPGHRGGERALRRRGGSCYGARPGAAPEPAGASGRPPRSALPCCPGEESGILFSAAVASSPVDPRLPLWSSSPPSTRVYHPQSFA